LTARKVIVGVLATVGALAIIAAVGGAIAMASMVRRGFSARDEPSTMEASMAQRLRRWSAPERMRNLKNPVKVDAALLAGAGAHWADHCFVCHANDGSGDTPMGRGMYPRAPDMRQAQTQQLSDGELYSIIQNGVRLTGMPAWGGDGDDDKENWALVAFIRHLPAMSADEKREMEKLNPKSPEEGQEERQEEDFLGGAAAPSQATGHAHGGHK